MHHFLYNILFSMLDAQLTFILFVITPEMHAEITMKAEAHGKSLNQWAAEALSFAE